MGPNNVLCFRCCRWASDQIENTVSDSSLVLVAAETYISPITVTARYTQYTFIYCRNTGKVGSNAAWCTDACLHYFCLHCPMKEWTSGRAYLRPKVSYKMSTNKIIKPGKREILAHVDLSYRERGTRKLLSVLLLPHGYEFFIVWNTTPAYINNKAPKL